MTELGSTNLGELVADHAEELAPLLGVRVEWLRGRRETLDDHLGPDLERLLRLRSEGLRDGARRAAAERSVEAAARLAATAKVTSGQVLLDAALLLGELLADPAPKFIALGLDGAFNVALHRTKLVQVARTLNRSALTGWVDERGLHLRWHAGRGGLDLRSQVVPPLERDRVLHVVFSQLEQPSQTAVPDLRIQPAARSWLATVLSELPALA